MTYTKSYWFSDRAEEHFAIVIIMKTTRKNYKRMILVLVLAVAITGFHSQDSIVLTAPDEFEIVRPVNKSKIRSRTTFSFNKIKRYWELSDNVVLIDKKKLEKEKIMKQRNWESLFFSDVNYSGLFIEPMLRFVQIVNGNKLSKFKAISDAMFLEVEKVILSHEKDWISQSEDKGYYIFPKNCPFYLDGVEMPVNEAAIFGSSLVRAYAISRNNKYKKRALQMWNRWKEYITKDKFGYISYPYFTGAAYNGWTIDDNISINTPAFRPKTRKTHESFHKAALTIDFLILLEQYCPNTMAKYLREFYYVMMASLETKAICSNFPYILGFGYPLNTYHSVLPYSFKGWVHLSSQDEHFSDISSAYIINKKNQPLENLLYFQYISERDINDLYFVGYSETVSPHYLEDKKSHCLWKSPISGLANIKFQHTSPKNNTLYLYDYENNKRRIRFNIIDGAFYSTIFVSKDKCIDVRWKKSKYGSPKNDEENKITLIYYKKQ